MEMIWSIDIDSILNIGCSLEGVGVRNWALERDAALVALEQLAALGVAVLGGDVYAVSGANAESNYDSWYCDREGGELEAAFVERSIAKARNYIANYHAPPRSVLFAIVPNTVG
jgi:hypothetical protein